MTTMTMVLPTPLRILHRHSSNSKSPLTACCSLLAQPSPLTPSRQALLRAAHSTSSSLPAPIATAAASAPLLQGQPRPTSYATAAGCQTLQRR